MKNIRFGIYVKNNNITKKQEIKENDILVLLKEQVIEANEIIKANYDLKTVLSAFITIGEHEALHQGQLIVMFRETKVEFPEEFKKAWSL